MLKASAVLPLGLVLSCNCSGQANHAFDHVKLIQDFVRPTQPSAPNPIRKAKPPITLHSPPPGAVATCAHIKLISPPADLDRRIIRSAPQGVIDNINIPSAISQCQEDLIGRTDLPVIPAK